MAAEYRTNEQIRAEADCEYHVFYEDRNRVLQHVTIIANDHEDALKEVEKRADCEMARLALKGEILVLWQG